LGPALQYSVGSRRPFDTARSFFLPIPSKGPASRFASPFTVQFEPGQLLAVLLAHGTGAARSFIGFLGLFLRFFPGAAFVARGGITVAQIFPKSKTATSFVV